jgi:hypothetical protein
MKLIIVFVLGFSWCSFGQTTIKDEVYTFLKNGSKDQTLQSKLLQEPKQNEVYEALSAYVSDSLNKNRPGAIQLIKNAEKKVKDPIFRKEQLAVLFVALEKMPLKETKECINLMCKYEKAAFTNDQIDLIRDYLALPKIERKQAVLLLGFVGRADDADYLNAMATLYPLSKEENYYKQLAQVRLKNAKATEEYLIKFKSMSIDDNFVTNLLKDAVYTRNMDLIQSLLLSCLSGELNCYSANNDATAMIPCAYRILEALAPIIQGFPVKIDRTGEIVGDPQAELEKAKTWIQAHQNDFILIDTNF